MKTCLVDTKVQMRMYFPDIFYQKKSAKVNVLDHK